MWSLLAWQENSERGFTMQTDKTKPEKSLKAKVLFCSSAMAIYLVMFYVIYMAFNLPQFRTVFSSFLNLAKYQSCM